MFHELRWLREPLIKDILQHYAALGDVQTCLAIAGALASSDLYQASENNSAGKPRSHHRGRRRRRQRHQYGRLQLPCSASLLHEWHVWYIYLLSKLQLWATANAVIVRSGDPIIKRLNQNATYVKHTVAVTRGRRSNAGVPTVWCAICALPVKGSYVWCQGCGHGGHADHLREWFRTETGCPVCGSRQHGVGTGTLPVKALEPQQRWGDVPLF